MALITYPLNDIEYTAQDAELYNSTRSSGVYSGGDFACTVSGQNNNVVISEGIGWIKNSRFSGKVFANKGKVMLALDVADAANPRIDVVAIRFDATSNSTDLVIKTGTASASPVMPEIAQTETVYELYLYGIYRETAATAITADNITDLRLDPSVCGLMADAVTSVDTTAINTQFVALLEKIKKELIDLEHGYINAYTREETLSDSTKTALGFSAEAVPDDAFNVLLGKSVDKLVIQKIGNSQTWIAPKAVGQLFKVYACGGGGGGGGGKYHSQSSGRFGGGGGGGGHTVIKTLEIAEGTEIDVICGAGGSGGKSGREDESAYPATDGGNGGSTFFGEEIEAAGGAGGSGYGHGGDGGSGGGAGDMYNRGSQATGGGHGEGYGGGGGGASSHSPGGNGGMYGGGGGSGGYYTTGGTSVGYGGEGGTYGGDGGNHDSGVGAYGGEDGTFAVALLLDALMSVEKTSFSFNGGTSNWDSSNTSVSNYGGGGGGSYMGKGGDTSATGGGGGGGYMSNGGDVLAGGAGGGGGGYIGKGGDVEGRGGGGGGGLLGNGGNGGRSLYANNYYIDFAGENGGLFGGGGGGGNGDQNTSKKKGGNGGNGGVIIVYFKEE